MADEYKVTLNLNNQKIERNINKLQVMSYVVENLK